MIRTQIQLTEEQVKAIKELAALRGISMAEVIRQSVERVIAESDRRERRQRAIAVLGTFADDAGDVSTNHDKYLEEAYVM